MDTKKQDLGNLWQRIRNTYQNAKQLYAEDRMSFYLVTFKAFLIYLFFKNLFRAFFSINLFILPFDFNLYQTKFLFFIIILVGIVFAFFSYLFFAYERNEKVAKLIFLITTIFTIAVFLLFLLIYIGESAPKSLSIGFYIDLILIALFVIMTWFESIARKVFGWLFKKELVKIGQWQPEVIPVTTDPEISAEPDTD